MICIYVKVFVSFILIVVVGEPCTTNGDCTTTICGTGSILCQHPDGQGVTENGGLCTCAAAEESGMTT